MGWAGDEDNGARSSAGFLFVGTALRLAATRQSAAERQGREVAAEAAVPFESTVGIIFDSAPARLTPDISARQGLSFSFIHFWVYISLSCLRLAAEIEHRDAGDSQRPPWACLPQASSTRTPDLFVLRDSCSDPFSRAVSSRAALKR